MRDEQKLRRGKGALNDRAPPPYRDEIGLARRAVHDASTSRGMRR
jgi:hypothetical protein